MGSRRPFSWYLSGTSTVQVQSVTDICNWLSGCEYVRDANLFQEPDFWQHPLTFEQIRKGDCEDHALWAWRKLLELGIDATFYVGDCSKERGRSGHAWVVFEHEGTCTLLEPVAKPPSNPLRPLEEVRAQYMPHFSVDRDLKLTARAGLLVSWREAELARRGHAQGQAA